MGPKAIYNSGDLFHAAMNYCSWGQVNILSPSTLPAGEIVSMQLFRNGTGSNVLSATVSPAEPSIFVADAGRQLGTVVFATGLQTGRLVTPEIPAHVGDIVSVYYTGCGPLSETLAPGQPAPADHRVYATLPIFGHDRGRAGECSVQRTRARVRGLMPTESDRPRAR